MSMRLDERQKQMNILFIDLLASVLSGKEPPKLPLGFNWKTACRRAQKNSVAGMLAYSLDKVNEKPDPTVAAVLENDRRYQILKETSQLVDVEKVLKGFDRAQIRNVPLKGYFMKRFYPQTDFRTMSDVDILVDRKNFKKTEEIFLSQGFKKIDLFKRDEVHFTKDLMYFEIHADLDEHGNGSYDDIWDRVRLRDDYKYSYAMSDEDFYVYMMYHTAKHFSSGGVGIRMVMDIFVYLQTHKNLDSDMIDSELEKLGISELEHGLRGLALNWFGEDKTEINELGEFVLYCSTFGDRMVHFHLDRKRTKRFYWLKQIFLPLSTLRGKLRYLDRFPFLLPFAWVHYWFSRIFIRRDLRFKEGLEGRTHEFSDEDREFLNSLAERYNLI